MSEHKQCDICGEAVDKVVLVSSGIAPVTYGACANCEERGAENLGVLSFWIAASGGPDSLPTAFTSGLTSHFEGEYKNWQDILKYYASNEAEIVSSFREEFELSDLDPDTEA